MHLTCERLGTPGSGKGWWGGYIVLEMGFRKEVWDVEPLEGGPECDKVWNVKKKMIKELINNKKYTNRNYKIRIH